MKQSAFAFRKTDRAGLMLDAAKLPRRSAENRFSIPFRVFALFAFVCVLCIPCPAAQKPNMLFLLSDDHSNPSLSCYGDTNVKTPMPDRLASEGMKFHRQPRRTF